MFHTMFQALDLSFIQENTTAGFVVSLDLMYETCISLAGTTLLLLATTVLAVLVLRNDGARKGSVLEAASLQFELGTA